MLVLPLVEVADWSFVRFHGMDKQLHIAEAYSICWETHHHAFQRLLQLPQTDISAHPTDFSICLPFLHAVPRTT